MMRTRYLFFGDGLSVVDEFSAREEARGYHLSKESGVLL